MDVNYKNINKTSNLLKNVINNNSKDNNLFRINNSLNLNNTVNTTNNFRKNKRFKIQEILELFENNKCIKYSDSNIKSNQILQEINDYIDLIKSQVIVIVSI